MKNKIMTADEAVATIKDGDSIMVGGFMACGTPEILIDALVRKNVRHLTIICNDAGVPGRGVGKRRWRCRRRICKMPSPFSR